MVGECHHAGGERSTGAARAKTRLAVTRPALGGPALDDADELPRQSRNGDLAALAQRFPTTARNFGWEPAPLPEAKVFTFSGMYSTVLDADLDRPAPTA